MIKQEGFINQQEISIYLKDVRKSSVLTTEQEKLLGERIKNGDKKAIDELIKANLRIVISIAKSYQNQGMEMADLISEGNYGLCKAIEKFDWDKDIKFNTYAVFWIKQAIIQSLNENARNIRLPVNIILEEQKSKKELKEDSASKIEQPHTISIHQTFNDEGDELLDILSDVNVKQPDFNLMDPDKSDIINKILNKLDEREKTIIKYYFGLDGQPLNLEHIGEELNLSKERVRQIKEKALKKLRYFSYDLFEIFN